MHKTINAITEQTDLEWPSDHPWRRGASVLTQREATQFGTHLVCSVKGTPRIPPIKPGDYDVDAFCCDCGCAVVHRASAPKGLRPICSNCWSKLGI